MKKFLATMLALVMALTLCSTAWAEGSVTWITDGDTSTANVTTKDELAAAFSAIATATTKKNIVINIDGNIDLTDWTAAETEATVGGSVPRKNVTINGNGHSLTGLTTPLFGKVNQDSITFRGLTIKSATTGISTVTYGGYKFSAAFIAWLANTEATFENCSVVDSIITSEDYAGAFVGLKESADENHGKTTFTGCAVTNTKISGAGSTGGLMGHAMASANMSVTVSDTSVTNCVITCTTENKAEKVGALFGTVGNLSNDKATVSATVSGNTLKTRTTVLDGAIYGRRGSDSGATLSLTGGSYDKQPLKTGDDWATVPSGVPVATVANSDNTVVSYNYGEGYVQAAAQNAAAGQTVTVTNGNVTLSNVPAGVKILAKESGSVTIGETEITASSNPNGYVVPCTVTFDADNGTAVTTVSVPYNTAVTAPTADPTKSGYTFKGWYSGDEEWNFDEKTVTESVTLTAKWEQVTSNNNRHFTVRPTTDTTPKAESPKTFDAGIAVYGVMAVSSLMGMGYVGKKKF